MKQYGRIIGLMLCTLIAAPAIFSKQCNLKSKKQCSLKQPPPATKESKQRYTTADLIAHVKTREDKRFVFIVPGYNNENWVERTLVSIFTQNYTNYHVICIDDASTDNAVSRIKACVAEHKMADKVTLIENKIRQGMMANRYEAVYQCKDEDICVLLDGDDWLFPDPEILSFYNKIYSDQTVWTTYGQYVEYPSGKIGFAAEYNYIIVRKNEFRKHNFKAMHLRTFYSWLFKLIKPETFLYKGTYLRVNTDWAIMYPILEMASVHTAFISKVTCVYNMGNPLSGFKKKNNSQFLEVAAWIKAQPPYKALAEKPELPLKINNYREMKTNKYIGVNG